MTKSSEKKDNKLSYKSEIMSFHLESALENLDKGVDAITKSKSRYHASLVAMHIRKVLDCIENDD